MLRVLKLKVDGEPGRKAAVELRLRDALGESIGGDFAAPIGTPLPLVPKTPGALVYALPPAADPVTATET